MRLSRRIGAGTALTVAALAVFVILWFPVLTGQRVLLGGDVLYAWLPWSVEPAAHPPSNILANDPVIQMLPWQELVGQQFSRGQLPLWNPLSEGGVPLLAGDQPAPFSLFTWLALPFSAAIGLSLAMLAKLLAAGFGMAFYLRSLKARGIAAAFGGIAYASSSFMVIWLAWPHTAVASLFPWAFAFGERYLRGGSHWAIAGLAVVVALQFLAGHAETSLQFGLALSLYLAIRWAMDVRGWRRLAGLAAAAAVGTLLAGIQLLPFLDFVRHATFVTDRSLSHVGFAYLPKGAISSWLFPNAIGNPAIDGNPGRPPNYSESTGFVGVAVLVLSPLGAWTAWRRERSVAIGLVTIGLISAGMAYGVLTRVTGLIPGLGSSYAGRLIVIMCFALAALGGLGLEGLLERPRFRPIFSFDQAYWIGLSGLGVIAVGGYTLVLRGQAVDTLLPSYHHIWIGFWLAMGAAALGTALAFVASVMFGGPRRIGAAGLCALALLEATIFAGPFNPREPLTSVPPHSAAISWLQSHAGDRPIAAIGTTLIPESASLYGLADVRGYQVLSDPRERLYWSAADPGYVDANLIMSFDRPGVDWLALAGVSYVMMRSDQSVPGASIVYNENGVAIAEIADARPFAYPAQAVAVASGPDTALAVLKSAPLGPVVIEGCCPASGSAVVTVLRKDPGAVDLDVNADSNSTVVVRQSFQPGWHAQVDGEAATVLPADVLFEAVNVPAGRHRVTLRYMPSSVTAGIASSAIGLLALLVLMWWPLILHRRRIAER